MPGNTYDRPCQRQRQLRAVAGLLLEKTGHEGRSYVAVAKLERSHPSWSHADPAMISAHGVYVAAVAGVPVASR